MNFFIKIGEKIGLIRPSRIANVLDGVDPTDAVNVRQLNEREASIVNYTEYRALLSQSGTDAPYEVDIAFAASSPFVDTIGGAWSYNSAGSFYYTKVGAFSDASKIEVFLGANELNQSPAVLVGAYKIDADTLELQTFEASAFGSFPLVGSNANGLLVAQPISIRIYN